ncbi:MAG: YdjC family protein [Acidimicrobiales bacterium]|nr:YdjC family protein [Acidimicrobiales bacterium]
MADRLLVVVADDFGLSAGTSRAIIEAHRSGIVTATSVLANAPATRVSLPWLAEAPTLEVGLHGALVGEDPPICGAAEIPTLVDRRGRLARSWRALVPRLAAGRVDPGDVQRELAAQLAVVTSTGATVTHLNLHQHLQLWPSVRPVAVALADAAGIAYVRTPGSRRRGPLGRGVNRLAVGLADELAAAGRTTNDGFLGLDEAGAWSADRLAQALATVPGTVVELNAHPGEAADPDLGRYRWGYRWPEELAGLAHPATRAAVTDAGFRLVGPGQVPRP